MPKANRKLSWRQPEASPQGPSPVADSFPQYLPKELSPSLSYHQITARISLTTARRERMRPKACNRRSCCFGGISARAPYQ